MFLACANLCVRFGYLSMSFSSVSNTTWSRWTDHAFKISRVLSLLSFSKNNVKNDPPGHNA